jgi:CHASE3 domain sensor protein
VEYLKGGRTMTINRKIIGGYVLILVMLAIITAIAFYSLNTIRSSYNEFIDVRVRLLDNAEDLKFELRNEVAHHRGFCLFPNERKEFLNKLQEDYRKFNAVIEGMQKIVPTEEGRSMLNDIALLHVKNKEKQEKAIALVQQGKVSEGLALFSREVRTLSDELVDKADVFGERQMKLMAKAGTALTSIVNRLSIGMAAFSIIALVAGLAIGFFTSRSISRQLRKGVTQLSSSSAEILTTTAQIVSGATETATLRGQLR